MSPSQPHNTPSDTCEITFPTEEAFAPETIPTSWALCGRVAPNQPVARIVISEEAYSLGRHDQNRLCLPNATVSSQHAELIPLPDGLLVRDLGSTNGTFVNGQRLTGVLLAGEGDILQFGSAIFHLESVDPSGKPDTEK